MQVAEAAVQPVEAPQALAPQPAAPVTPVAEAPPPPPPAPPAPPPAPPAAPVVPAAPPEALMPPPQPVAPLQPPLQPPPLLVPPHVRLFVRLRATAAPLFRLLGDRLFLLTVLLPTLLSAGYYGLLASDIYVSDAKFVVRMPQRPAAPSLMGALMQGSGFLRAQDDAFTVHEYMQSRDALRALEADLALRRAFSATDIDRLARFPAPWADDSFESLFRYFGQRVNVSFDAATAITTLRVTAFRAADAQAINARLLDLAEARVNEVNNRGRGDLIRYAQAEVDDAEQRAKTAAAALASYRTGRAVFDPERQSGLQLQTAGKLQEELTTARDQLAQVVAAAPQNPQIPALRLRVQQLESAAGAATAKVTGAGASLSSKVGDYERLTLERGFADRQLASALAALETARNEARRQQLYLERVVEPNLPDLALEPRRWRNVTATLLLGLLAWGVATLMLSAVREHRH